MPESKKTDAPAPVAGPPANRWRSLMIIYLLTFVGMQAYFTFFAPKPDPVPLQQQADVLRQAADLEQKAMTPDPQFSTAERIKSLESANKIYEKHLKDHPDAHQIQFNVVNNFDRLAQLQAGGNNHYYDQAEQRLKDLEKKLHKATGSVNLVVNGKNVTKDGNLAEVASWRLNEIRAARDARNQSKWTWRGLDALVALTGRNPGISYFLALAFIVIFLKSITYPFLVKQYAYQKSMMKIQPLVKEMQEQMKGRPPEEVNRRMMEIYRENNVNILGGCLPMFVTGFALLPVFYMVRDYEFQFTKATFLWIGSDQSAQYWWMGDHLAQFDVPLFLLYLASQLIYPLTQPKPADPQQAKQQQIMLFMMPIMFGVFMWMYQWSSAFILYWLVLNVVSIYQYWTVKRRLDYQEMLTPAAAPGAAPALAGAANGKQSIKPMEAVHTPRKQVKRKSKKPSLMDQMPQQPQSREVRRRMKK